MGKERGNPSKPECIPASIEVWTWRPSIGSRVYYTDRFTITSVEATGKIMLSKKNDRITGMAWEYQQIYNHLSST